MILISNRRDKMDAGLTSQQAPAREKVFNFRLEYYRRSHGKMSNHTRCFESLDEAVAYIKQFKTDDVRYADVHSWTLSKPKLGFDKNTQNVY